jgi:hypothetical protein
MLTRITGFVNLCHYAWPTLRRNPTLVVMRALGIELTANTAA